MSPKRKVADGSNIWQRILDELGWDSPDPGQLTEDEIARRLQISTGAAIRALEWAYEDNLVGFIRSTDGTVKWHRRMPRKAMIRHEIYGKRDYCLRCDTIGGHKEGCIHGK
jgi:predicted transcriptional regulator